MEDKLYLGLLIVVVLFVLSASAYLSLAEASLSNISQIEVRTRTQKDNKSSLALLKIMENRDPYLAAIWILNVAVNTGGSLSIGLIALLAFDGLHDSINLIFYLLFTMSILYIAEMIPKLYAIQNTLKVSLMVARTILACHFMIGFIVKFSTFVCSPFLKKGEEEKVTISDLKSIIKFAKVSGVLNTEDANIIKNTLKMGERTVSDIMIHAKDIEFLSCTDSISSNKDKILSLKHHRIIVVKDGDKNKPIGVVLKTQLLESLVINNICSEDFEELTIKDLMHDLLIVEETDTLSCTLINFNKNEDHLAVVQCKDGSFKGVLSAEDILLHITQGHKK
jgi:putative hemolysin